MAVLDVATYRALTGDASTAATAIDANIARAQSLIEEYLDRPLDRVQRSERLRVAGNGRVYPRATPLASADGYATAGEAVEVGGSSDPFQSYTDPFLAPEDGYVTVSYLGGFTTATAPQTLLAAIATVARRLVNAAAISDLPADARSVTVGDVSVVRPATGEAAPPAALAIDSGLRTMIRQYRRAWRE